MNHFPRTEVQLWVRVPCAQQPPLVTPSTLRLEWVLDGFYKDDAACLDALKSWHGVREYRVVEVSVLVPPSPPVEEVE